jgi:S-(hydroxymethyl)glutathione dehydrogenase / alcohol dehydrogenase
MLALTYRGPYRVRVVEKPIPKIEHPRDAIVRVTRACICGSVYTCITGSCPTRASARASAFVGIVEEVASDVHKISHSRWRA